MNLITFDPQKDRIPNIIRTKCLNVEFPLSEKAKFTIEELKKNLSSLIIQHGNKRGIGLSANQIGINLNIAIVNFGDEILILINPKFISSSTSQTLSRIGCLSFFRYRGMVRHPKEIEISFQDMDAIKHTKKFNGDKALIILHEIDHLNGISLMERCESGIFIPWEIAYPIGSKVPFKNWGIVFAIRKHLFNHGINLGFQPQTDIQYYSRFFREKLDDLSLHVSHSVEKRSEMIDLIKKYTPQNGKILEAGCGTSFHSIYLSKKNYKVTAIDIENDMIEVAKKFNKECSGNVTYISGDIFNLPFSDKVYDTVFSHGVLEHFSKKEIVFAINEALRVANTVIISVPTIFDVSNNLMGDEILRSIFKWKRIIKRTRGQLKEIDGSFPFHPRLRNLQKVAGNILNYVAPVAIFVITKK